MRTPDTSKDKADIIGPRCAVDPHEPGHKHCRFDKGHLDIKLLLSVLQRPVGPEQKDIITVRTKVVIL